MKLEAGKFYRTRVGKKAYVACLVNPLSPYDDYPITGFVNGEEDPQCWTVDGSFYDTANCVHDHDLVTDWRDQAAVNGWVVLFNDGSTSRVLPTEREARAILAAVRDHGCNDKLAVVYVEGIGEYELGDGG